MRTKSLRYRLEPTPSQKLLINRFVGSCRFVYNQCLSYFEAGFKKGILRSYNDYCKYITRLKRNPEYEWLSEPHSQILQQSAKDLYRAVTRFLKPDKNGNKLAFPRYQKRGNKDSMRYPQGFKIKGNKIYCPKIGWVRYRNSRPLEGKVAQITLKREGDQWFVTIVCHCDTQPPQHQGDSVVGIDVGINSLAVLSNGDVVENPRPLKKNLKKLARAQKALARKKKGSKRRARQRKKVAKLHVDIKNIRKDYLHKVSTTIVKNHDAISVETLSIKGMVKNHRLAQSISDASWGIFLRMLEYKCEWAGKQFIKIARFLATSQLCSSCNNRQKMPLKERTFYCNNCDLVLDRDLNASINIQAAGHAVIKARGAT